MEVPAKAVRAIFGMMPMAVPAAKSSTRIGVTPAAILTTMKGAEGTSRTTRLARKPLRPIRAMKRSRLSPANIWRVRAPALRPRAKPIRAETRVPTQL